MLDTLKYLQINEIFFSIQGEASYMGYPCIFIRLMGCNLRCTWCDTAYAFYEGKKMSIAQILEIILSYPSKLVQITGGEPLLQENTYVLIKNLHQAKYKILLETSGATSIQKVPPYVHISMDLKAPGSNEQDKNSLSNIDYLKRTDDIKVVIANIADFEWVKNIVQQYNLFERFDMAPILQPVFNKFSLKELANLIQYSSLPFRLGIQLHKFIYPESTRGV